MKSPRGVSAVSVAAFGLFLVSARQGTGEVGGAPLAFVRLQASSLGTAQAGHSNITGTSIDGLFVGGAADVTSVDADLLNGLGASELGRTVVPPLTRKGRKRFSSLRRQSPTRQAQRSGPCLDAKCGPHTPPSALDTGCLGAARRWRVILARTTRTLDVDTP